LGFLNRFFFESAGRGVVEAAFTPSRERSFRDFLLLLDEVATVGLGLNGTSFAIGMPSLVMMIDRRVLTTSAINRLQFLQNSTSETLLARTTPSPSTSAVPGKSCIHWR